MSQEDEIPKHYQPMFTQNVEMLVQKSGSILFPTFSHGVYKGESAEVVKQFGPTVARRGDNSRHGDTPIMTTPRDQRWVFPEVVDWGDLFDRNDLMKQLIDPTSPITTNAKNAVGRALDEIGIEAFFGDAKTGKNGGTTTQFDDTNMLVDVDVGSNAATGMNVAKIIRGRRLLRAQYAITATDDLHVALASQQEEELFNDDRFVNTRYRRSAVLEDADSNEFFRCHFHYLEELPYDPAHATYRWCPMWVQSGMHFGMWENLTVEIGKNPNKKFNWQLYIWQRLGATRVQEKKVVKIKNKES